MNNPRLSAQFWIGQIAAYEREFKEWESKVEKIVQKYRGEQKTTTAARQTQFNILWSNVQTLMPAVFARLPKPDVSRRFRDNDPVGRVASLIIERGLEFEIDHYPDYRAAMKNSVQDRFLGGRGVAWVRYEPHLKPMQVAADGMPEDGVQITEDADESETAEAEQQEEIDYECSPVDYVHWKDFGHTYARTWEEVTAIWRRVYLDRPALVERFGEEIGNKIPLDTRPEKEKSSLGSDSDGLYQACIYEIWDKTSNRAIWISKSYPDVLDERDDPLKLESFWPCPRPLYATLTNNSLVPIPDYLLYQDQALSLDLIAERIDKLIQALQVKGVHDAAIPELARLFSEAGNTDLIPVKNWQAFTEKNGLKGAIDLVDLTPIVAALQAGYQALEEVKNEIYEIMGIADIIRGASDPDETLGAQKLKGQFGSLRLRSMQAEVAQYAAEILQIKAQIMCTSYQPETLLRMAAVEQMSPEDQQLIPQAIELLRDRPLRNFRIEVTADSLVQLDEMQEKADRMEFLKATGQYLQNLVQLSQSPAAPQLAPLAVSMMKFGVTAFKVGKGLEGEFDATVDRIKEQIAQKAQQPQQPPGPIQLEMVKQQGKLQEIQMQSQADAQRFQAEQAAEQQSRMQDLQLERERIAMEAQAEATRQQREMMVEQHKQEMQAQQIAHQNQLEAQRNALQAQQDAVLERQRMAHEEMMKQAEQAMERWKAELEAAVRVEVANIAAKTRMQDAATQTSTNEIATDVRQDDGAA
jgi:hypothetical protein